MPKKNVKDEELKETLKDAALEGAQPGAEDDDVAEMAEEGKQSVPDMTDDGYVEYCLPFLPGVKPGEYQTVTINGKNYQVKYGETVRMPVGVKEVLENMVKRHVKTEETMRRMQENTLIAKLE